MESNTEIKKVQKNRIELLAPAGNYEAFLGAVNAGADAVYLGGKQFGARAYADNFTTEEICQAIHTAHFMGIKIYLTVNTLMKETELEQLYDYLFPLYETGLDAVIVQDLGVLCYIRERFPGLAIHASTQMTVTGAYGASFLKEQGAKRIVPARELSLKEICTMKTQSGLEIECFIHGAMCYSYSGQCLFSSLLGGRSGNRGRCAQPCRLPYQIYEDGRRIEGVRYPLSLKDMCTLSYIPQLIESGIDSFKIEGRMKKAEYAAGVTALYRKYIDLYYQKGFEGYQVEQEDMDKLRRLYIRSEIQTGYYERHNGPEMITLHKPGYMGSDRDLLEQIRSLYLREANKHPVKMKAVFTVGKPACLELVTDGMPQTVSITVYGAIVEAAEKKPLQEENICQHLSKTGHSLVAVSECKIVMEEAVFLPVSALNELRRKGVDAYEKQYIEARGMISSRSTESVMIAKTVNVFKKVETPNRHYVPSSDGHKSTDILVTAYGQFHEAVLYSCRRIYIDSDLYLQQYEQVSDQMRNHPDVEYYLALPYILRLRDKAYIQQLTQAAALSYPLKTDDVYSAGHRDKPLINGFLIRNLEEAAYVRSLGGSYTLVPDAGLYTFNTQSVRFWAQYSKEFTLPYELNKTEAQKLVGYAEELDMKSTMIVYGRIPMMITANCVKKTAGNCGLQTNRQTDICLKDRYGATFPVASNCRHCYNIIYNSVPYSLHLQEKDIKQIHASVRRYDFTIESSEECHMILEGTSFPYEAYTTGHLKRGVE